MRKDIELLPAYPSQVAQSLLDGSTDLGIVPVAVIPEMREHHIISDYCIGCDGPVASVCLFSDVPVEEIKTVLLDYQSRTSVALARLLLQDYWKVAPVFLNTQADFRDSIKGSTAGVVIGDRALEQRRHSPYIYDLGEAWKAHTGLPFVFAAWVSNKPLPDTFVQAFNEANRTGIKNIGMVVSENPYQAFDLHEYYTKYISYTLDTHKKQGLRQFLDRLCLPVAK